jgi:hypothetical protein
MSDYNNRKHIRYPAEPNELVTIHYMEDGRKTMGQRVGLGENESFHGCCVVFVGPVNLKQGQDVLCESRTLPKVKAKVAWVKKLDDQITKAGFSLTE